MPVPRTRLAATGPKSKNATSVTAGSQRCTVSTTRSAPGAARRGSRGSGRRGRCMAEKPSMEPASFVESIISSPMSTRSPERRRRSFGRRGPRQAAARDKDFPSVTRPEARQIPSAPRGGRSPPRARPPSTRRARAKRTKAPKKTKPRVRSLVPARNGARLVDWRRPRGPRSTRHCRPSPSLPRSCGLGIRHSARPAALFGAFASADRLAKNSRSNLDRRVKFPDAIGEHVLTVCDDFGIKHGVMSRVLNC